MPIPPGLVIGLLGCGDPTAEAMASYHEQMAPLMVRNVDIANRFLDLAGAVHQNGLPPDDVIRDISTEIVPAADALKDAIAEVRPTEATLLERHARAVEGWTLQADAYRALTAAYGRNDLVGFTEARNRLSEAKVLIETYLDEVNLILEPHGCPIDAFPQVR
ncbi:MAG: hypothetical protein JXB39_10720 [Deltaproteobacteria bacterium]|nr:hypothetical protein [Deltaproteobacteria bacterium]